MEHGLKGKVNVKLGNKRLQNMELGAAAEEVGVRELPAEMGIQVKALVTERGESTGQVLGPLNARMPVGHRKKQQARSLGNRKLPVIRRAVGRGDGLRGV